MHDAMSARADRDRANRAISLHDRFLIPPRPRLPRWEALGWAYSPCPFLAPPSHASPSPRGSGEAPAPKGAAQPCHLPHPYHGCGT